MQDVLNIVALAILTLMWLGMAIVTPWVLRSEQSFTQFSSLVVCLFGPLILSPVVAALVMHAGIRSMLKPTLIVSNAWGWQLHHGFGRCDVSRPALDRKLFTRRMLLTASSLRLPLGCLASCYILIASVSLYAGHNPCQTSASSSFDPVALNQVSPYWGPSDDTARGGLSSSVGNDRPVGTRDPVAVPSNATGMLTSENAPRLAMQPPKIGADGIPVDDKDIRCLWPCVPWSGTHWTNHPDGAVGAVNGMMISSSSFGIADRQRHIVRDRNGEYIRLVADGYENRDQIYRDAGF